MCLDASAKTNVLNFKKKCTQYEHTLMGTNKLIIF